MVVLGCKLNTVGELSVGITGLWRAFWLLLFQGKGTWRAGETCCKGLVAGNFEFG